MSASASKSALILSPCLRWAGAEGREYREENTDTSKRDKGTLFHAAMDRYYTDGDKWLKVCYHDSEVSDWVQKAIQWSKEALEPRCVDIHSEVYVAYNFDTDEVHVDEGVRDRKYPNKPGLLPGTTDLACILKTGELLVADWKTGGGIGADKQLLTLACGLREVYRDDNGLYRKVLLSLLYAGPNGVQPVEWAASESDLFSHKHAMAFQLADLENRPNPVTGIHCSQLYCPHLAYCPGVTEIVEELSESPQSLLRPEALMKKYTMTDSPISDEEAGHVMERITSARRQMKYYEECMRKYIIGGGRAIAGEFEFKSTNSGFRWVKR